MNKEKLLEYLEEKHREAMEKSELAMTTWKEAFQCGKVNFIFELIQEVNEGKFI